MMSCAASFGRRCAVRAPRAIGATTQIAKLNVGVRWKAAAIIESVDVKYRSQAVPKREWKLRSAPKELRDLKVGFIGWGNMAQAISLGMVRQDLTDADKIKVTDVVPQVLDFARKEGLSIADSIPELVEWADIVVFATKPQVVRPLISQVAPVWKSKKVLISICAGITNDTFLKGLGTDAKVVRVMPNTPCLIGQSATAYSGSPQCEDWELDLVHRMFEAVGPAIHRLPENLMNTVTGVSGSATGFVYMMIQALSDAGVHGGLPRSVALSLATQTVYGAAQMVQESGDHPAVLKEAVTSPAGTTIAGLRVLERHGFASAIIEAAEASRMRSEELGKTPEDEK